MEHLVSQNENSKLCDSFILMAEPPLLLYYDSSPPPSFWVPGSQGCGVSFPRRMPLFHPSIFCPSVPSLYFSSLALTILLSPQVPLCCWYWDSSFSMCAFHQSCVCLSQCRPVSVPPLSPQLCLNTLCCSVRWGERENPAPDRQTAQPELQSSSLSNGDLICSGAFIHHTSTHSYVHRQTAGKSMARERKEIHFTSSECLHPHFKLCAKQTYWNRIHLVS